MGILDADAFASDEARDWLLRLDPADGSEPLTRALMSMTSTGDAWLDAARAQETLAAAELVAALHGHPHPALPATARSWVVEVSAGSPTGAAPGEEMLALATRALDLVVTSSALSELWSQQADEGRWRAAMDDLRLRLSR
jgi:hypothetical protein